MTDYEFKNGVSIHFPDGISKEQEMAKWINAKMAMSVLMTEWPQPDPKGIRKPYKLSETGIKKRRLMFHKGNKKK